jgi:hypothetical protein
MRVRELIAGVLVVAGLAMMVGCGGLSSASKSTESNDSGPEPSKEFLGKGKNGKLAKIGQEASAAEREAASQVLERSLNAREEGDWQAQCETLAAAAVEQIEKGAQVLGAGPGCAKALEAQAAPLAPESRENTMTGPIDAFRINQKINGFAFYHGTKKRDFVIPLIKQGGEWKVVVPQEQEIK